MIRQFAALLPRFLQQPSRKGLKMIRQFAALPRRYLKQPARLPAFVKGLDPITFFCVSATDRITLEPIAEAARSRGHKTVLTSDLHAPAKVGIYCHHDLDPSNSIFSVALLHDTGQEYWPDEQNADENFWKVSPWNGFDIGILPGPVWSRAWRCAASKDYARPRVGVFEVGWPKADRIFSRQAEFQAAAEALKARIGLKQRPSIILAPSWETPDKQRLTDFVQSLEEMPVNLLVKYWPEIELDSSFKINTLIGRYNNLVILDPTLNILDGLGLADIVVSEESNCMVEALLFDIPGIAVKDWDVPAIPEHGWPGRAAGPPPWATKVHHTELRSAVETILQNPDEYRARARKLRDDQFSNLGRASTLFMDILDSALAVVCHNAA